MVRKGILLAGGTGSRLHPVTVSVSKQLLPVFDKPMIYYSLSTLMLAGIRDVLLISTPTDVPNFRRLLADGSQWGLRIAYAEQREPKGIAQALLIAADYLAGAPCVLVLGDNIFYGHALTELLDRATSRASGATVFLYRVKDPERYGVAELTAEHRVVGIAEKPAQPKSNYALTGLYYYDGDASALAATLQPSPRGELEISDLNRLYLDRGALHAETLGRGFAWFDTGTHESLLEASQFVASLEHRQGLKIGCPEEIAFNRGWIDRDALRGAAALYATSSYGDYLRALADDGSAS